MKLVVRAPLCTALMTLYLTHYEHNVATRGGQAFGQDDGNIYFPVRPDRATG